jgi:hypothetical protein
MEGEITGREKESPKHNVMALDQMQNKFRQTFDFTPLICYP